MRAPWWAQAARLGCLALSPEESPISVFQGGEVALDDVSVDDVAES